MHSPKYFRRRWTVGKKSHFVKMIKIEECEGCSRAKTNLRGVREKNRFHRTSRRRGWLTVRY